MKLADSIFNIRNFFFYNNALILIKENGAFDDKGNAILEFTHNTPIVEHILTDPQNKSTIVTDLSCGTYKTAGSGWHFVESEYYYPMFGSSDLLKYKRTSGKKEYYFATDTGESKIEENDIIAITAFANDDFFGVLSKGNLLVFQRSTGDQTFLFKYDVPIFKILGFYRDCIWVATEQGEILIIDLFAREKKFILGHPTIAAPKSLEIFWSFGLRGIGNISHFDAKQERIIALRESFYFTIDLNNPVESYTLHDIQESLHEFDLTHLVGRRQVLHDDLILFDTETFNTHFGFFSQRSKEIIWLSTALGNDGKFSQIRRMDFNESNVYILDGSGNLYVFNR